MLGLYGMNNGKDEKTSCKGPHVSSTSLDLSAVGIANVLSLNEQRESKARYKLGQGLCPGRLFAGHALTSPKTTRHSFFCGFLILTFKSWLLLKLSN